MKRKRRSDEATKRRRGGFTLVEMVVVIGIIVALAALTFAVGVAVVQNSEVRQTEATIRLLDAAVKEWEAQSDRKLTAGPAGQGVFDIDQGDAESLQAAGERITEGLFAIISRNASVRQILAQVDPRFVEREEVDLHNTGDMVETYEFRDAWGNLIVAVLPGRAWVTNDFYDRDEDGTIRTQIERTCGRTANRQVCFVSAGPDGEFGDIENQVVEPARDNVYSYPTDVVQ